MEVLLPLLIAVVALTVTAGWLAYMAWSRSRRSYKVSFTLLMAFVILLSWGYLADAASPTLETKLIWNNVEYLGYIMAAAMFLVFSLQFTGRDMGDRRLLALVFVPAAIFVLSVWSNPLHHLFYRQVVLSDEVYRSFDAVYGPLFAAYAGYMLTVLTVSLTVLFRSFLHASQAQRRQLGVVILAGVVTMASVAINFIVIEEIPGSLLVVLGLLASCIIFFLGAFKLELFGMLPYAMDRVMETMKGGVIILDDQHRIVFVNRSAERIAMSDVEGLVGRNLCSFLPFPEDFLDEVRNPGAEPTRLLSFPGDVHYEVQVACISAEGGGPQGKMVLLRDETQRVRAERAERETHGKLDLLNSITRHDILNQLVVIEGHLVLAQTKTADVGVAGHVARALMAAKNIDKQITFSKDYQEVGVKAPDWQSIVDIMNRIPLSLNLKDIELMVDMDGYEVLADPLLEKVFYNLVDNSLHHGENVTRISIAASPGPGGLSVVYRDNGVGVPAEVKPKLFKKGFGKNTGLGLFLTKDILAFTGITIREDGVPGEGVRFEMMVPVGSYRRSAVMDRPPQSQPMPSMAELLASG